MHPAKAGHHGATHHARTRWNRTDGTRRTHRRRKRSMWRPGPWWRRRPVGRGSPTFSDAEWHGPATGPNAGSRGHLFWLFAALWAAGARPGGRRTQAAGSATDPNRSGFGAEACRTATTGLAASMNTASFPISAGRHTDTQACTVPPRTGFCTSPPKGRAES